LAFIHCGFNSLEEIGVIWGLDKEIRAELVRIPVSKVGDMRRPAKRET
jgi:hypothetical protein